MLCATLHKGSGVCRPLAFHHKHSPASTCFETKRRHCPQSASLSSHNFLPYLLYSIHYIYMATPRYRTLSHVLASRQVEPASKKAKWSRESQRKCGESYDGPVVHITDYGATTLEADGEILMFSLIQPPSSEKLQAWKSCQEEAVSLVDEYPIDFLVEADGLNRASKSA